MNPVVVASKNPDKVAELEAVLAGFDPPITVVRDLEWPDVEETEPTLEGNAVLKAAAVVRATGHAAIADDTGLEVDALFGEPGVQTARYAGSDASYTDNVARLLEELAGVDHRSARFRTVIALADPDGTVVVVEGVLEGSIARQPRGGGGFGYDPVFEVHGRTLAEIPIEEKNRISHRARALQALEASLPGR
jgi:XTP/dITP diphosphohydrolase